MTAASLRRGVAPTPRARASRPAVGWPPPHAPEARASWAPAQAPEWAMEGRLRSHPLAGHPQGHPQASTHTGAPYPEAAPAQPAGGSGKKPPPWPGHRAPNTPPRSSCFSPWRPRAKSGRWRPRKPPDLAAFERCDLSRGLGLLPLAQATIPASWLQPTWAPCSQGLCSSCL